MTRTLIAALALAGAPGAWGQTRTVRNAIGLYTDLDLLCRGEPGDNPLHYKICAHAPRSGGSRQHGLVLRQARTISAEMRWHPCEKNSIRYR